MEKLVEEIGQRTQLRLLDLSNCFRLEFIPPNLISSLSRLEELYIGESPIQWEVGGVNTEKRNASLDEWNHLSKLTSLEILIEDAKTLPRDLFFKKLERYKFAIGEWRWDFRYCWDDRYTCLSPETSGKFHLKLTNGFNIPFNEGHMMQLKGIEDLSLDGLLDMKSVLFGSDRDGFPQLKRLEIKENSTLFCVVDSMDCVSVRTAFPLLDSLFLAQLRSLENLCRGPLTAESFCKFKVHKGGEL